MLALATEAGLLVADASGSVVETHLRGRSVVSVARLRDEFVAAVPGEGVLIGAGSTWRPTGLEDATLWRVCVGNDGSVYAGIEPAAILRLDDGAWTDLVSLSRVQGHDEWESPWGDADLSSIVADGDRIIVGIEVGGVAVSHDRGETFEARNNGLFEDVHTVVADGDTLYATTGGGLHRSLDEGLTWSWESAGLDRGYSQGIALADGHVIVAAASGPPPFWESGGAQAAIFRSRAGDELRFEEVTADFEGNVGRRSIASDGERLAAGTSAGELLLSDDAGGTFTVVAEGLPEINAVEFYS